MNLLVIWFVLWRLGTSFSQMMIMKTIEISKINILRTIEIQTITACWVECRQTAGCETIGTDPEYEKKNDYVVDCYLFKKSENKYESPEKISLKATEISQFTVSYYEFVYSIICRT